MKYDLSYECNWTTKHPVVKLRSASVTTSRDVAGVLRVGRRSGEIEGSRVTVLPLVEDTVGRTPVVESQLCSFISSMVERISVLGLYRLNFSRRPHLSQSPTQYYQVVSHRCLSVMLVSNPIKF